MDQASLLILGASGQLGLALQSKYPNAKKTGSEQLDISDQEALAAYDWSGVKIIINAAAYTDVDGAETAEGRVAAWKANAQAVGYLAELARQKDITLVHVSTDYVFDGSKSPHTEDEVLSPLSVYGASKAAGDIALGGWPKHYLLRSSWIIGEGKNFVRTMLELGKKDVSPSVVADQIGRPTLADEIARGIDHLLTTGSAFGIYNLTNSGDPISWADLTREIFKQASYDLTITNTTTEQYFAGKPMSARRPISSIFDLSKIEGTGFSPRDWRADLQEYIRKELEK